MRIARLVVLAGLLLPGSTMLLAQARTQDPMLECRGIGNKAERLDCYDKGMDAIYGVDEELVAQREERAKRKFGLPEGDNGLEMTEMTAKIANVYNDMKFNQMLIELDNGQLWRTTSTGSLRSAIRPGREATIGPGLVGGYRIRVKGGNGFRGVIRIK